MRRQNSNRQTTPQLETGLTHTKQSPALVSNGTKERLFLNRCAMRRIPARIYSNGCASIFLPVARLTRARSCGVCPPLACLAVAWARAGRSVPPLLADHCPLTPHHCLFSNRQIWQAPELETPATHTKQTLGQSLTANFGALFAFRSSSRNAMFQPRRISPIPKGAETSCSVRSQTPTSCLSSSILVHQASLSCHILQGT